MRMYTCIFTTYILAYILCIQCLHNILYNNYIIIVRYIHMDVCTVIEVNIICICTFTGIL